MYDKTIVTKWFAQHDLNAKPEWRFDPERRWRFDFAFPVWRLEGGAYEPYPGVALEVEGGVFTGGRHTRPTGFIKDMEKYNRAAVLGWRVLRVTPNELCMQETVEMVKEALK